MIKVLLKMFLNISLDPLVAINTKTTEKDGWGSSNIWIALHIKFQVI